MEHFKCMRDVWGGAGRGEGRNAYKALLFLPFHPSLNPQILVVYKTSMCHIMSNQNTEFLHRKITHIIP